MTSVAVLVDLVRGPGSGGHVKCWERFAESAARLDTPAPPDLTVYVLGAREGVETLAPHVRLVALRPVLATAALTHESGDAVDVTDLAPHHARLAALLPRHDVWHLTHDFAYAATAVRLARAAARRGGPAPRLVASVHTDVPALAAVYSRDLAARRLPAAARRPVGEALAGAAAACARRRRDRLLRACERVLAATEEDRAELAALLGPHRVGPLRRGTDHRRFRPDAAARAHLTRAYGIPADRTAVLFAGRLDASKGLPLLAESLRLMRDRGTTGAHLVLAGAGAGTDTVRGMLGADVTVLGRLPQEELARVYAGCDVFAFPSRTETCGNVVAEAMASGLAVVLPRGARTTRWLAAPGRDGVVVPHDDPGAWATALTPLVTRPGHRAALGARAAKTARATHPTWDTVLTEDLLPLWNPPGP